MDNKIDKVIFEFFVLFESEEIDVFFLVEIEISSCLVSEVYVFVVK